MQRWVGVLLLTLLAFAAAGCGPAAGAGSGALGDLAWLDANGDGIQQQEESGVPGVRVELHTADRSAEVASTVTGDGGIYAFDGVAPGSYRLFFDPPPDLDFTQKDKGDDDDLDSDVYPSGPDRGWTDAFEFGEAGDSSRDAGLIPGGGAATPTPTPLGKVGGGGEVVTTTPTPQLGGEVLVCVRVFRDVAGHANFIRLGERTTIVVRVEFSQVTLDIRGEATETTNITLIDDHLLEQGGFEARGTGTVAGFENIAGVFVGRLTLDDYGDPQLTGTLSLGVDGKLPQGADITYEIGPC